MPKTNVIVLGGTGMLGSMIVDVLSREDGFQVAATARDAAAAAAVAGQIPNVEWKPFNAETAAAPADFAVLNGYAWIVNAIGIIKPYIRDDNAAETERAIRVNALFPHLLARHAEAADARVLQIATDCVYSGMKGRYVEADAHDALDVYGKTKSLGEVHSPRVHNLRCSIIGPELKSFRSLLNWFLGQPQNATVSGYTNHRWNGVTTMQYARLCRGIIREGLELPHLQHIVPTGDLTKCEMLQCFAKCYGRTDVTINASQAAVVIDRTLGTSRPDDNERLWKAAGYAVAPTVPEMIAETAAHTVRLTCR